MKNIKISDLNKRIVLQGYNQSDNKWSFEQEIWASIAISKKHSIKIDDYLDRENLYSIIIRDQQYITNDMRILYNSKFLRIKSIINTEQTAFLSITADEYKYE